MSGSRPRASKERRAFAPTGSQGFHADGGGLPSVTRGSTTDRPLLRHIVRAIQDGHHRAVLHCRARETPAALPSHDLVIAVETVDRPPLVVASVTSELLNVRSVR